MKTDTTLILLLLISALIIGCSEEFQEVTPTVTTISKETPIPSAKTAISEPTATVTPLELDYGVKYRVEVVDVVDGDTIDIILPNGSVETVRMLGVDTPETSASKNKENEYDAITNLDCLVKWGGKAKEYVASTGDKHVYIEFDSTVGMRGYYGRLLAYVYFENETDLTAELVKRGYARVYTEGKCSKESEYAGYQENAINENRGLWSCREATTPTISTSNVIVWEVHEDTAGNDNENLNDEYVVLKNTGNSDVNLQGWVLKDEAEHVYNFPDTILEAGSTVTIHTGSGTNSGTNLYWGSGTAVWNNEGDTVYLLDNGSLVDSYSW